MIEFIPLSSGSHGNCYVVRAEGHAPLLIDPGIPFAAMQRKLWEVGINVSDLAGALCSHHHQDHAKAVPKLLAAGVDVYASREAWEHMGLAGHRAKTAIRYEFGFQIGDFPQGWNIYAFDVVHDDPGTIGFVVNPNIEVRTRLLFITDSAYSPHRYEGLTHICCECNFSEDLLKENAMAGRVDVEVAKRTLQTHASIERVVDMLKANDLSRCEAVYLMHLSRSNSNWRGFKDTVAKATGCAVYVCAENGGIEE